MRERRSEGEPGARYRACGLLFSTEQSMASSAASASATQWAARRSAAEGGGIPNLGDETADAARGGGAAPRKSNTADRLLKKTPTDFRAQISKQSNLFKKLAKY